MDFSGLLNKLNSLGKPDDWVVDAVLALEAKSDLVKLAVVNATDEVAIKLVNKLLEDLKEEKEYLRSTRVQAQRAEAQKRTAGGSGGDSETGGATAAGGGVNAGGAGVGAPPARRRLVDSAAKLLPQRSNDEGIVWELTYSDRVITYVDAAGVVEGMRSWAAAALRAAVDRSRENAPAPLLVSGLIKTGKSYTLEHVVPAVVAEALCTQQQAEDGGREAHLLAGMVVLRLRGDALDRSGATAMLRSLLFALLRWAHKEQVPMREDALATAKADLALPDISMLGPAIHDFLKAVEVPVLVLCDELQSLFLPTIGGKLDVAGAGYIRDTFMKQLLVYGPHTVLWCLTGSSMAQIWISLANMPPNGYAVITSVSATHLPATYSAAHMEWAWQKLQQGSGPAVPLDRRLQELCPRSIALLTLLVTAWIDDRRPSDVAAFVQGFMQFKLVDESRKEWKLGLEAMPLSQRLAILDLSFPAVGARINMELHPGLRRYLLPHLNVKVDGRYYLRDSYQRQIVQLLIDKYGELRESWSEQEFSATLMQLDGGWNLLYLGETADYVLGPKASHRWQREEPPAGMNEFEAKLQAIADDVANKLLAAVAAAGGNQQQQQQPGGGAALCPQELWERQPWFQKVLNSKWNNRDREAYMKNKQERHTHLAMLVFYLRLSRNVLVHTKPWDSEAAATVDVGVIEALPGVLGQPLFDFNEAMVDALRLLSRATVLAAAAEIAAELSGGGSGGSIEGSAEDDSSRGGGLSSGAGGSSGGGLRSGSGGAGSTSSGGGRGSSSGGGGRGRGARAMPDQCAPSRPGPAAAAAGCGQRPPLVYATSGSRGGWGKGGPRAPTLAPCLRVRLPPVAPAAAVGPRLPCR